MAKSPVEKAWIGGGVVAAALMIVVGYFMVISPQRSHTRDVKAEVASAQLANVTLQHRIDLLKSQNNNLAKYQAAFKQAQLALPDTSGLSDFLRTLQSIGNATQATVTSLSVGTPIDVKLLQGGAAGESASSTATSSTATSSTATSSSATSTGGATAGEIFALKITAQLSGTVAQLDQFLVQLQSVQPRAVLISQIAEGSTGGTGAAVVATVGSTTTMTLTMQAFTQPVSADESAQLSAAASGK